MSVESESNSPEEMSFFDKCVEVGSVAVFHKSFKELSSFLEKSGSKFSNREIVGLATAGLLKLRESSSDNNK